MGDAAKRVNQLCQEMEIPLRNPEITGMPNELSKKKREKTSQYKGVYGHKNGKWLVHMSLKGKQQKYGGYFREELDAAKKVNQLCEEMEIPLQNPGISAIPTQQSEKKETASQYKGVSWNKENGQWRAEIQFKKQKQNGGYFREELDAAKKVNQLCEKLEIPLRK